MHCLLFRFKRNNLGPNEHTIKLLDSGELHTIKLPGFIRRDRSRIGPGSSSPSPSSRAGSPGLLSGS